MVRAAELLGLEPHKLTEVLDVTAASAGNSSGNISVEGEARAADAATA